MIQKVHAYQTSDEQTWPTMELAQERELILLLGYLPKDAETTYAAGTIGLIVANKAKVMDILTMKKSSRPKARKINRSKETNAHDNKAA